MIKKTQTWPSDSNDRGAWSFIQELLNSLIESTNGTIYFRNPKFKVKSNKFWSNIKFKHEWCWPDHSLIWLSFWVLKHAVMVNTKRENIMIFNSSHRKKKLFYIWNGVSNGHVFLCYITGLWNRCVKIITCWLW